MKLLSASFILFALILGARTAAADAAADFGLQCAKCHGSDGRGQTTIGKIYKVPDFTLSSWSSKTTPAKMHDTIVNGAEDASGRQLMPAFKEKFNADQINALVEYVQHFSAQTTSNKDQPPTTPK